MQGPNQPGAAGVRLGSMSTPLQRKFTLAELRAARQSGTKVPMLTCYDYTTARLMQEAGVAGLLVGDSAANVILGYSTTLPVSLEFMIEITAAVRRGAPLAFVVADMPFGSYQSSVRDGARNVFRMIKSTGCDCVKLEVSEGQEKLIQVLSQAGVAVMAHLGLRPQSVALTGYRYQGRTAEEAARIVELSLLMQSAGAAAILLEAVPPEVAKMVVESTCIPVVGCGAGPHCHGTVIVAHDALGLTPTRPRFVPMLGDLAEAYRRALAQYVEAVTSGTYPSDEHNYLMAPEEASKLNRRMCI